jgi:hypothetical protein
MKKLIFAVAFASIVASPALAQSYNPDVGSGNIAQSTYAPAAPPQSYAEAPFGHARGAQAGRQDNARSAFAALPPSSVPTDSRAGSSRTSALRECSAAASKYTETTWGNMEVHQFRTCMVQHGQVE